MKVFEEYFAIVWKASYGFVKLIEPDFNSSFIFRDITNNIIKLNRGFDLTKTYDKNLLDIFRKHL
jgi:hypothetical protein